MTGTPHARLLMSLIVALLAIPAAASEGSELGMLQKAEVRHYPLMYSKLTWSREFLVQGKQQFPGRCQFPGMPPPIEVVNQKYVVIQPISMDFASCQGRFVEGELPPGIQPKMPQGFSAMPNS